MLHTQPAVAREAGLDFVVDHKKQDVKSIATYGGKKFDRIILLNGNNPVSVYQGLLASGGVIVGIGAATQAMKVMVRAPFSKESRAYSSVFTPEKDYLDQVAKVVSEGKIAPHVDAVYPISRAGEAVEFLMTQHAQGKVVIAVDFEGSLQVSDRRFVMSTR